VRSGWDEAGEEVKEREREEKRERRRERRRRPSPIFYDASSPGFFFCSFSHTRREKEAHTKES
jgi:hypothetical protein